MKELFKLIQKNPGYFIKRFNQKLRYNIQDLYLLHTNQVNPELINKREFRVCGLRRSGNHAIINWIMKQTQDKAVHINDIFIRENPFRACVEALSKEDPDFYWKAYRLKSNNLYCGNHSLDLLRKEANQKFLPKDLLLYSLEDYPLRLMNNKSILIKHRLFFGRSQEKRDILILRDPFNLLSSRLNHKNIGLKTRCYFKSFAKVWVEYAKEFIGETNHLTNPKILINFNRWSSDREYRKTIAHILNIPFTDKGFNHVPNFGGGSSFNSKNQNSFEVNQRWEIYQDHQVFRKIIANRTLKYYAKLIFPDLSDMVYRNTL
jgi:hypothetical protein